MKKFVNSISVRQWLLGISGAVSLLIFVILSAVISYQSHRQLSQQMAERWSADGKKDVAQVSCFFSPNAEMNVDIIETFRHSIDGGLQEASIAQDSPNAGARLWADAYSADGKITLQSERASLEADAIGVGGDFFLFHPLPLVSGSYFSESDLNQDYCVIDEDAAWQLFGSNDVAGKQVTIRGIPHTVVGVVSREQGRLSKAAGLDGTVVYVSYSTLLNLGSNSGINHYEVVMPNPVSKFAYNYVKEHIGAEEKEMELVENTSRYGLLERLKIIGAFGTRSMNGKAIIYPYWENIARGYEDVLALLTLIALLFLLYPAGLALTALVIWWKHKSWTVKDIYLKLKDKGERRMEKFREKRRAERKNGMGGRRGERVEPESGRGGEGDGRMEPESSWDGEDDERMEPESGRRGKRGKWRSGRVGKGGGNRKSKRIKKDTDFVEFIESVEAFEDETD